MKARSLAVRIADFIKEHPPFSFVAREELVVLAGKAKVRFHEEGENLFEAGTRRDAWFYVIQQGTASVLRPGGRSEELIDLRGEGDILGLQGFIDESPYAHTARSRTEMIVYCLPRKETVELLGRYPRAGRYLAAYFSLNPYYEFAGGQLQTMPAEGTSRGFLEEVAPLQERAAMDFATLPPEATACEAARLLCSEYVKVVVVLDDDDRVAGLVTDATLRRTLATGFFNPGMRLLEVMEAPPPAVSSEAALGHVVLRMLSSSSRFLQVTDEGREGGTFQGIIGENDLALVYGRIPTVLAHAIDHVPTLDELPALRKILDAQMLSLLGDRKVFPWLVDVVAHLNRRLFKRVVELAVSELAADGFKAPGNWCFVAFGSAARRELTVRADQDTGLIFDDLPADAPENARRYYRMLGERVTEGLERCGYRASKDGMTAREEAFCASFSEWKERFSNLAESPCQGSTYSWRLCFDIEPIAGARSLATELSSHIRRKMEATADLIPLIAHDAVAHLPPVTIFRDLVVGSEGSESDTLELKRHALKPLADIARLFALEFGAWETHSTHDRLLRAASIVSQQNKEEGRLLVEAAEAFRAALYIRTLRSLKAGTDGAVIRPANLSREQRELLKTIFRSVLELISYAGRRYGLQPHETLA